MANPKSQKIFIRKRKMRFQENIEREQRIEEDRLSVCDQKQLSQSRGKRKKTYQIEKDQH